MKMNTCIRVISLCLLMIINNSANEMDNVIIEGLYICIILYYI